MYDVSVGIDFLTRLLMKCPRDGSVALLFLACSKSTHRTAIIRKIVIAPCDYCSHKFEALLQLVARATITSTN